MATEELPVLSLRRAPSLPSMIWQACKEWRRKRADRRRFEEFVADADAFFAKSYAHGMDDDSWAKASNAVGLLICSLMEFARSPSKEMVFNLLGDCLDWQVDGKRLSPLAPWSVFGEWKDFLTRNLFLPFMGDQIREYELPLRCEGKPVSIYIRFPGMYLPTRTAPAGASLEEYEEAWRASDEEYARVYADVPPMVWSKASVFAKA